MEPKLKKLDSTAKLDYNGYKKLAKNTWNYGTKCPRTNRLRLSSRLFFALEKC